MLYLENYDSNVLYNGLNTKQNVDFSGSSSVKLPSGTTSGAQVITAASANAFDVGPNGSTNPTLQIDTSTASAATGVYVKSAAAGSGVAVSTISSGTNENLTIDAKGTGTVTINGTATGAVKLGASSFLSLLNNGTASATAGAATLAKDGGVITSESLTTAAGATYTLTITDTVIAAADLVFASVSLGTSTTGTPAITTVTPAAGSLVIVVQNIHASAAFNGTIKIAFMAIKTV